MTELAFRAHNDSANIVVAVFPTPGGDAVLREAIPLNAVGLGPIGDDIAVPHDMPFGTYKVRRRKTLVDRGLKLVIDFDGQRIALAPRTHDGDMMDSKIVRYTFDDFSVEDQRQTDIKLAQDRIEKVVRADPLPLSDETWPPTEEK